MNLYQYFYITVSELGEIRYKIHPRNAGDRLLVS